MDAVFMIRLYNTITRKKEAFRPLKGRTVRMYTCGPTVYNYAHIGNLRSYIFSDTLKRVLLLNNYRCKHVMNITDVGHLSSDADIGEDKMLIGAQREGKTVWEIAQFYTDAFFENTADLNILAPTVVCKATDHIFQQIALIQKLEKKGFTYLAGGNVYFDTTKLNDYGKLARAQKTATPAVARVEGDGNKKHPQDFVLWFTKSKFQDQDMKWESPWGIGYPGWHIECSAMSSYYLGQPFDIHTGGIDHIPVHHTNEIAQSEAAFGKPLAHIWMHGEFLVIDAKRMGKSEGNFLTLASLKERGYDPLDYRFFLLQTHYRQQLNFTFAALDAARNGYLSLKESVAGFMRRSEDGKRASEAITTLLEKVQRKYSAALADDCGTPQALATLFELIRDINRREKTLTAGDYKKVVEFFLYADCALGLGLDKNAREEIPQSIIDLAKKRETARTEKKWNIADDLRLQIANAGYTIEDAAEGPRITKQ